MAHECKRNYIRPQRASMIFFFKRGRKKTWGASFKNRYLKQMTVFSFLRHWSCFLRMNTKCSKFKSARDFYTFFFLRSILIKQMKENAMFPVRLGSKHDMSIFLLSLKPFLYCFCIFGGMSQSLFAGIYKSHYDTDNNIPLQGINIIYASVAWLLFSCHKFKHHKHQSKICLK